MNLFNKLGSNLFVFFLIVAFTSFFSMFILAESDTSLESKKVEKWDFEIIDTFISYPIAVTTSSYGTIWYVTTDDYNIKKYVNGKFEKNIKKFESYAFGIATTSDGKKVWTITTNENHSNLWECDSCGNFKQISNNLNLLSEKIAVSADGKIAYIIAGKKLEKYIDGKFDSIVTEFNGYPSGVATTANGKTVWIIIATGLFDCNGELWTNKEGGNFEKIDNFSRSDDLEIPESGIWTPTGVALSSDGKIGFVATAHNNIIKYINGKRKEVIGTTEGCPLGIATTADGNTMLVITSDKKLIKVQESKVFK